MILYESDSTILSFDSSIPCLDLIVKEGFRSSKDFKKCYKIALEKFIELKKHYSQLGIFIDARDLSKIKSSDMDWLAEKIFPRFEEAGLTKKAFLYFDSESGKTMLAKYKDKLNGTKIVLNEFKSFKVARAWLKEYGHEDVE